MMAVTDCRTSLKETVLQKTQAVHNKISLLFFQAIFVKPGFQYIGMPL